MADAHLIKVGAEIVRAWQDVMGSHLDLSALRQWDLQRGRWNSVIVVVEVVVIVVLHLRGHLSLLLWGLTSLAIQEKGGESLLLLFAWRILNRWFASFCFAIAGLDGFDTVFTVDDRLVVQQAALKVTAFEVFSITGSVVGGHLRLVEVSLTQKLWFVTFFKKLRIDVHQGRFCHPVW